MTKITLQFILSATLTLSALTAGRAAEAALLRWPEEKAWAWHQRTGWLVGCNFLPSTAINQLEMFQADTFDVRTIDRELGWAQSLGFNSVRVYLHHLLRQQDAQGFLRRLDRFLDVAAQHGIGVVFVLFDSWTKSYEAEPVLWFHDIFRRDGTPYRSQEVACIRDIKQSEVLFSGADLTGWRQPRGDWQVAGGVHLDPAKPEAFAIASGQGVMVNGTAGRTVNLMTEAEFGDVELHVEFCLPKRSNSGVYLQGRYEIQVYDSAGVEKDAYPGIECGGIYPRWINNQNIEGHSPRLNASKPPGDWQSFDIVFRAPRFDASGAKTANARMIQVRHNGQVIHENVELHGPTRAARWNDEKPLGPILLQGDHGPVAYRNLRVKRMPPVEPR